MNYDGGEAVEAGGTSERSVNYELIMLAQVGITLDESILIVVWRQLPVSSRPGTTYQSAIPEDKKPVGVTS